MNKKQIQERIDYLSGLNGDFYHEIEGLRQSLVKEEIVESLWNQFVRDAKIYLDDVRSNEAAPANSMGGGFAYLPPHIRFSDVRELLESEGIL